MSAATAGWVAVVFAWAVAAFLWAGPVWRLLVRRWTWRQQVAQVWAEADLILYSAARADCPRTSAEIEAEIAAVEAEIAATNAEIMRWIDEVDGE